MKWEDIFKLGSHVDGHDSTLMDVSVLEDLAILVACSHILVEDGYCKEVGALGAFEA